MASQPPVGISEEDLNARIEAAVQKHLEKQQKEKEADDNSIKKPSPVAEVEQVASTRSSRSMDTVEEKAAADGMTVEERKDRAKVLVNLARQRHDEWVLGRGMKAGTRFDTLCRCQQIGSCGGDTILQAGQSRCLPRTPSFHCHDVFS